MPHHAQQFHIFTHLCFGEVEFLFDLVYLCSHIGRLVKLHVVDAVIRGRRLAGGILKDGLIRSFGDKSSSSIPAQQGGGILCKTGDGEIHGNTVWQCNRDVITESHILDGFGIFA